MASTWVSYGELTGIIGTDMASVLCRTHGGVDLHIPKMVIPSSQLAKFIGYPALRSLSSVYGGTYIVVPNHRKDEPKKSQVLLLLDEGMCPRDIALNLALTERYVRHVAASARPGIRQASLFDF